MDKFHCLKICVCKVRKVERRWGEGVCVSCCGEAQGRVYVCVYVHLFCL